VTVRGSFSAVVAVGLAAAVGVSGCAGSHARDVQPVHPKSVPAAYQQQVDALVRDWGSIAVQGMRPAIADLAHPGGVPRAGIATEATAWTAALKHDREQLQQVVAPASYEPTRQLLLRSIDGYLRAAVIVHVAAEQPNRARRHAALERAVQVLTSADRLFDQARAVPS
jgi:hypothetical protein